MKIGRFGNQVLKINATVLPKVLLKLISPIKLLSKFHNDSILGLAATKNDVLQDKKGRKSRPLPIVSGMNNEIVDGRFVLEVYKRLVSNREVAAAAASLL